MKPQIYERKSIAQFTCYIRDLKSNDEKGYLTGQRLQPYKDLSTWKRGINNCNNLIIPLRCFPNQHSFRQN